MYKIKKHSVRRKLGQNYLTNSKVIDIFLKEIIHYKPTKILEVGTGEGVLTEKLTNICQDFTGIEKDRENFFKTKEKIGNIKNAKIVLGNVLDTNFPSDTMIVGAPPYSISSELIKKIVFSNVDATVLIVQKEFADKIMTLPGDSTRSYLAALISIVGDIKKIIDVNRESFNPVPQVDSSLININFSKREKVSDIDLEKLSVFLFRLFKHRRKTVKALFNNILERDVYSVYSKKRVFELNESDLLRLYLENEKK